MGLSPRRRLLRAPRPTPAVVQRMSPEAAQDEVREASATAAAAQQTPSSGGRFRKLLVIAVLAIVLLGGGGITWHFVRSRAAEESLVNAAVVLAAFDSGEYAEACALARALLEQPEATASDKACAAFVEGASLLAEAEQSLDEDNSDLFRRAADQLQQASQLGWPPEREADGLFWLGKSLQSCGQYSASRPVLREALAKGAAEKTAIHDLLAESCLRDAKPQYAEALHQNTLYLGDKSLTPEDRNRGLARQATIQLRQGDVAGCVATIEQIPRESPQQLAASVLRGQVLMREAAAAPPGASDAAEKYRAAIELFRNVQSRAPAEEDGRQAAYLISVCLAALGDQTGAFQQFTATARRYPGTAEAQAALVELGSLARQTGRDAEALEAHREALRSVKSLEDYSNPWVTLEVLRQRTAEAYQQWLEAGAFAACLQLVAALEPAFPAARAAELRAETHRAWGRDLLERAARRPRPEAQTMTRHGREQLRLAGRAYRHLAEIRSTTRHYLDDLWNAAECAAAGHEFSAVVATLKQYAANEPQPPPQVAVRLGEAYLSLGRYEEAIVELRRCLEDNPRDVASFRARVIAAQAYAEIGKAKQAEQLLKENLLGDLITPASQEWRDSLFSLGRLLHSQTRYGEAIERLEEAVRRYPEAEQMPELEYLAADACRRVGEALQDRSAPARNNEDARRYYARALDHYRNSRQQLQKRQHSLVLSAAEDLLLRNCYFAIGALLAADRQYEEAIREFSATANHYQNSPAALEAYVQMAESYRQLNRQREARVAIELARLALARIKPAEAFAETTNYSQEEWAARLQQLSLM